MAGSSLYQSTSQVPTGVTVVVGPQGESGFAIPVETVNASGALELDYSVSKHYHVNVLGNITSVSIIGWPASGNFARLTAEFHNTGNFNIVFPSAFYWSGPVPTLTGGAGTEDWFAFTTSTGGTRVTGHYVGANYT